MKNEDPRRAGQGAAGAKDVDPFEQRQSTSPPVSFQLTRKVDWALEHAKRGWHVIPLAWPVDGRCSCGNANCSSPAKHPLTRHGEKDASVDPAQINAWWKRWPDANIGIAARPSELVLLDIDGKEGRALYDNVAVEQRKTLVAKTGRPDGYHIYYKGAGIPSSQVKGQHLDVRGNSGYVVAPGSVHINGTTYVFINPECEPQPVPDWVAPWVASRSGRTKVPPNDNPSSFGPRPDYLKNLTRTSHS